VKIIIAGDREIDENNLNLVHDAILASGFNITQVVSGVAKGGDTLGENWAKLNRIRIKQFKADWNDITAPGAVIKVGKFGPYNAKAGFDRNQLMADYAEGLIALQPNGETGGTSDMIDRARKRGIPVFVYPPNIFTETSSKNEYVYTF